MASTSKSYICNGRVFTVEEDLLDDIRFQSFSSIEDMTALSEKQNNRQSGEQAEDDVQHRMSRSTTSHRKRGRPRNQPANPTPDRKRAKRQNQANESDDFESTVAKLKEEVKVRSINEENLAKLLQQTQAEKKIETEKYRSLEKHSEELKQSLVQSNANLEKLLDQSNEKIETISKLCQDREHQIEKVETELKVVKEELLQTRVSKSDSDILALSNSLQDFETKIWRQLKSMDDKQEIILKKIDETDQLKQDLVERNKTIRTLENDVRNKGEANRASQLRQSWDIENLTNLARAYKARYLSLLRASNHVEPQRRDNNGTVALDQRGNFETLSTEMSNPPPKRVQRFLIPPDSISDHGTN